MTSVTSSLRINSSSITPKADAKKVVKCGIKLGYRAKTRDKNFNTVGGQLTYQRKDQDEARHKKVVKWVIRRINWICNILMFLYAFVYLRNMFLLFRKCMDYQ